MDLNEAAYSGLVIIEEIESHSLSGNIRVSKRSASLSLILVLREGAILQNVGWVHQQNVVL